MQRNRQKAILAVLLTFSSASLFAANPIRLNGTDFKGADHFRDIVQDRQNVGSIYPVQSKRNTLTAEFEIEPTSDEFFVYINGSYYKNPQKHKVNFCINGTSFYKGSSRFSDGKWSWETFTVPSDVLTEKNTIKLENLEEKGLYGDTGCFMIWQCVISERPVDPEKVQPDPLEQFGFDLDGGQYNLFTDGPEPGFKFRGIKGWNFSVQDYLDIIPFMAENKMNFLMNCYLSVFPRTEKMLTFENCLVPHHNNWWEDISASEKEGYQKIVQRCKENNIIFCFSMNPNYHSTRAFDYKNEKDFNDLLKHYLWAQSIGVRWFNVSFDDIKTGIDPKGQAQSVSRLLSILREKDSGVQMIFCPTYYRGPYNDKEREYLEALKEYLPQDTYIFWTGAGRNQRITKQEAAEYKEAIGRRLILWDNYPVNNGSNTMHLGPLIGRDPQIVQIAEGYISNPMWPQVSLNQLPLITAADFAYNPWQYDARKSIAAAIKKLTESEKQAQVIRELVNLYHGKIYYNRESGFNSFIYKFNKITEIEHSRAIAQAFIKHSEAVLANAAKNLPDDKFKYARQRLSSDIKAIKKTYDTVYGKTE
jgi:hypothetical protein